MRAHIPTAPFGPAVYYSRAVERSYERDDDRVPFETIDAAIDSGAPTAYFVSDHGLENLQPDHYPSSWLTISPERLPAQERSRLEAVAPVKSFSDPIDGPLTFSGNARGFAFFDRSGDLVILAARKDWDAQQAVEEEVTITLSGLENGTYSMRDALKDPYDETFSLSVSNGEGSVTFRLERWDTRVFVLDYDKTSTAVPRRPVSISRSSRSETVEYYTIDGRLLHQARGRSIPNRISSHGAQGIVVIRSKDRSLKKKVLIGRSGHDF
jgi:hypothetical protein